MAISQREADDLGNIQSQLIQLGSSVQNLISLTNNISNGRATIQNTLKTMQFNINTINQDVSRQLTSQRIK